MTSSLGGIGMNTNFRVGFARLTQRYSQIFPSYSSARRPTCKDSALARIKEKRVELKALSANV
jgi:hypothetical protein